MLAKDHVMIVFRKCFEVFKSSSEKQSGSTAKKIKTFLAQFQSSETEAKEEENQDKASFTSEVLDGNEGVIRENKK